GIIHYLLSKRCPPRSRLVEIALPALTNERTGAAPTDEVAIGRIAPRLVPSGIIQIHPRQLPDRPVKEPRQWSSWDALRARTKRGFFAPETCLNRGGGLK